MKRSEQINELAAALTKAQAMMRPATKDSTNPHFKSKYADLASVVDAYREPFAANGLSLSQHPMSDGERVVVITVLMHSSGQWLESELAMVPQQRTPQAVGSAITYARRYAAMAVAGLASDDDDGEAASHAPRRQPVRDEPPEDVPFEGPPAKIGAPQPISVDGTYTEKHKSILFGLCKEAGVGTGANFFRIHDICLKKQVLVSELQAEIKKYIGSSK